MSLTSMRRISLSQGVSPPRFFLRLYAPPSYSLISFISFYFSLLIYFIQIRGGSKDASAESRRGQRGLLDESLEGTKSFPRHLGHISQTNLNKILRNKRKYE